MSSQSELRRDPSASCFARHRPTAPMLQTPRLRSFSKAQYVPTSPSQFWVRAAFGCAACQTCFGTFGNSQHLHRGSGYSCLRCKASIRAGRFRDSIMSRRVRPRDEEHIAVNAQSAITW